MNRRKFFGAVLGAAAASRLPVPELPPTPTGKVAGVVSWTYQLNAGALATLTTMDYATTHYVNLDRSRPPGSYFWRNTVDGKRVGPGWTADELAENECP